MHRAWREAGLPTRGTTMSTPHWAATVFIASMVSAGVPGSDTELRIAVARARDRLGAFLDQRYIEFIHDTDPTGFQPFELEPVAAQHDWALLEQPAIDVRRRIPRFQRLGLLRLEERVEPALRVHGHV